MDQLVPHKIITEDISKAIDPDQKNQIHLARLDMLHSVVSGNKIFKLACFIDLAKKKGIRQAVTFGGAYSNHLAAASHACRLEGIELTGIIRGEKPEVLSHTLDYCISQGMKVEFSSREKYRVISVGNGYREDPISGNQLIIPEGGFHQLGMLGAANIMDTFINKGYTHICTAAGTGTTLAGLISRAPEGMHCMGISVLKGKSDFPTRLAQLTGNGSPDSASIIEDYHFGGYAVKNKVLFDFMNGFYKETGIPTDFVYTGKMIFAIKDLVTRGFFPEGSRILCLHTGGLQGNLSLPAGTLIF